MSLHVPTPLSDFLDALNLPSDQKTIYTTLVERGICTILELSRHTKISRTQIYRLAEEMKQKGLVEIVVEEHKTLIKPVDPAQLELLIVEQKHKLETLQTLFPHVQQLAAAQSSHTQADSRVQFYRGEHGIKQMGWNILRAKKEIVGFSYRSYEEIVGEKFQQELFIELAQKQIHFRDIYSDTYIDSFPDIRTRLLHPVLPSTVLPYISSRYIPPNILTINHQMDIYNDVVAHYSWYEGEIFGIEMYNEKIADFHRQLFELVWNQGITEQELLKKLKQKKN